MCCISLYTKHILIIFVCLSTELGTWGALLSNKIGNETLQALSRYILPETSLTLLECVKMKTQIGVLHEGKFVQAALRIVNGKKEKARPQWDKNTGLPVGKPWVGISVPDSAANERHCVTFDLYLESTGGNHRQKANPDNLHFDSVEHITKALGSNLLQLHDFNSKHHTSSAAVVVIDPSGCISLCFPLKERAEFYYELPPVDLGGSSSTCGKKRPQINPECFAQGRSKVLKSVERGVTRSSSGVAKPAYTKQATRSTARLIARGSRRLFDRFSRDEEVSDMEVDFDVNNAFAEMNLVSTTTPSSSSPSKVQAGDSNSCSFAGASGAFSSTAGAAAASTAGASGAFSSAAGATGASDASASGAFSSAAGAAGASAAGASGAFSSAAGAAGASAADDPWAEALADGPQRDPLCGKGTMVSRLKPSSKDQEGDMLGCLVSELSLALSPAKDAGWRSSSMPTMPLPRWQKEICSADVLSVGSLSLSLSPSLSLFL
jgi:hypothetical protein